jgi:heat shock protein HslJ
MRISPLLAPLLATALLAACQPADPPASTGGTAAAITPADLAGSYRVASAGGAPVDQAEAITATLTAGRIDVQSGCIRFAYDYRLDGGALTTTSAPVASCRRGLTPAEQAVQQAFAAATQVARTASNGVQFSGSGRSVTLSAQ